MDLTKLNADLTRDQADKLFTKDYQFSVLEDLSVRREWVKGERFISLDFSTQDEKLCMAEIRYDTPIAPQTAIADANKMAAGQLTSWKKAKTSQAESIGLGNCYYTRTENGCYYFVEVNTNGNAFCTIFFNAPPKTNRRVLLEAKTNARTAMGVSSQALAASELNIDELERLNTDPNAATKLTEFATQKVVSKGEDSHKIVKMDVSVEENSFFSQFGLSLKEALIVLGVVIAALVVMIVFSYRKTRSH